MDEAKQDLKKALGSSYLVKFSEDVETLLAAYSQYVSVEIQSLKQEEVDMNVIEKYSDTMRTYVLRAYISFLTLFNIINKHEASEEDRTNKLEIDKIVKIIKENAVINSSEIETFLISMNAYIYSEPIKKLMDSAQQTMADIYNLNEKNE